MIFSSLHFCCILIYIAVSSKPQSFIYSASFFLPTHVHCGPLWPTCSFVQRRNMYLFHTQLHLIPLYIYKYSKLLMRPHLPQTHTPRVPTAFTSLLTLSRSYCVTPGMCQCPIWGGPPMMPMGPPPPGMRPHANDVWAPSDETSCPSHDGAHLPGMTQPDR